MSSTLPITPPETPHTSLSVSSKLKLEVPTPSQPVNSTHFKRDLQPEFTKVGEIIIFSPSHALLCFDLYTPVSVISPSFMYSYPL